MTLAQRQLLIGLLALLCGGAACAADAPPADAKKEEKADDKKDAKAEAPAVPALPSKPYPKNATPKAFAPRGEPKSADEAVAAKPADKPADKAETPADKHAEKHGDKAAESKAVVVRHTPAHDRPAAARRRPAVTPDTPAPVKDPALAEVAGEAAAQGKPGGVYRVKAGENLDSVIRKTMPDSPFSMEVMREAYARANPQLLAGVKAMRLKSGTTLNLPDAGVLRQVVLGDARPKAEPARPRPVDLHSVAPVVAPTMRAADTELNLPLAVPRPPVEMPPPAAAEMSADDKRRWVRYP